MSHYETDISKHRYPGIARATLEMSYCNGGVNRDRRESEVLEDLENILVGGSDLAFDLPAISQWLAALDDETLGNVVDGDQDEAAKLMEGAPAGTDALLNEIFYNAA
jgi:hypothetical protein